MPAYVPVLILGALALGFAVFTLAVSQILGRPRPTAANSATYECGVPVLGTARQRFPIKFYLVRMIFILFDVDAAFVYPWALVFRQIGWFGFIEMAVFIAILAVGDVYAWKMGGKARGVGSPLRHRFTRSLPFRGNMKMTHSVGACVSSIASAMFAISCLATGGNVSSQTNGTKAPPTPAFDIDARLVTTTLDVQADLWTVRSMVHAASGDVYVGYSSKDVVHVGHVSATSQTLTPDVTINAHALLAMYVRPDRSIALAAVTGDTNRPILTVAAYNAGNQLNFKKDLTPGTAFEPEADDGGIWPVPNGNFGGHRLDFINGQYQGYSTVHVRMRARPAGDFHEAEMRYAFSPDGKSVTFIRPYPQGTNVPPLTTNFYGSLGCSHSLDVRLNHISMAGRDGVSTDIPIPVCLSDGSPNPAIEYDGLYLLTMEPTGDSVGHSAAILGGMAIWPNNHIVLLSLASPENPADGASSLSKPPDIAAVPFSADTGQRTGPEVWLTTATGKYNWSPHIATYGSNAIVAWYASPHAPDIAPYQGYVIPVVFAEITPSGKIVKGPVTSKKVGLNDRQDFSVANNGDVVWTYQDIARGHEAESEAQAVATTAMTGSVTVVRLHVK